MGSKKILVTGGAGYIGSHTVVELVLSGYEPVVIDDFSNSDRLVLEKLKKITGREITCYEGDCAEEKFMAEVFRREKGFFGVIHFAAYKAVGESVSYPLKYYANNIGSLIVIMKLMKDFGVRNLVFSSSCTVYGQPDTLPVTEQTAVKMAESPYGNTKQIGEEILFDEVRSGTLMKSVVLRYFNPIGAHPSGLIGELPKGVPNNLVPFITQTAAGLRKELTVFGNDYSTADGSCVRDYIHVVDLAKAHIKAFEWAEKQQKESLYEVFNCGTGKGNTVLEVIQSFEKVSGEKLNYKIGPRRPGDVEAVYADVAKVNEKMNWRTELDLDQALKDAWNWQKTLI